MAKILGHANLPSVIKYVHPSQHHMGDALLRFGGSEVGMWSVPGVKWVNQRERKGPNRKVLGSRKLLENKIKIQ